MNDISSNIIGQDQQFLQMPQVLREGIVRDIC
jgi:hypothetical protein